MQETTQGTITNDRSIACGASRIGISRHIDLEVLSVCEIHVGAPLQQSAKGTDCQGFRLHCPKRMDTGKHILNKGGHFVGIVDFTRIQKQVGIGLPGYGVDKIRDSFSTGETLSYQRNQHLVILSKHSEYSRFFRNKFGFLPRRFFETYICGNEVVRSEEEEPGDRNTVP